MLDQDEGELEAIECTIEKIYYEFPPANMVRGEEADATDSSGFSVISALCAGRRYAPTSDNRGHCLCGSACALAPALDDAFIGDVNAAAADFPVPPSYFGTHLS